MNNDVFICNEQFLYTIYLLSYFGLENARKERVNPSLTPQRDSSFTNGLDLDLQHFSVISKLPAFLGLSFFSHCCITFRTMTMLPTRGFAETSRQPVGKYDELLIMVRKPKLGYFGHVSRSSDLAKTIL